MEVSGKLHAPAVFSRERKPVSFGWEAVWVQDPVWKLWGRDPTRVFIILEQRLSTKEFLCLCKNYFFDTDRLHKNTQPR